MIPETRHQIEDGIGVIVGGKIIKGKGHIVPFNDYKKSKLQDSKELILLNKLSSYFNIKWKRVYSIVDYEGRKIYLVKGEDLKRKNFYFNLDSSYLCSMEDSVYVTEEMDLGTIMVDKLFQEK